MAAVDAQRACASPSHHLVHNRRGHYVGVDQREVGAGVRQEPEAACSSATDTSVVDLKSGAGRDLRKQPQSVTMTSTRHQQARHVL